MAKSATRSRIRNRRGEGGRLRDEIVAAAGELLEENGNEAAITLRAVARRIGITAPSIYPHFADRVEILRAVIARAIEELVARLLLALQGEDDPVARLRAGCHAYANFAAEQPHRYRVHLLAHAGESPPQFAEPACALAQGPQDQRLCLTTHTNWNSERSSPQSRHRLPAMYGDAVRGIERLIEPAGQRTARDRVGRTRSPLEPVLVLTSFGEDDVLRGAIEAGAAGFMLKDSSPEDLIAAVRVVAGGGTWFDLGGAAGARPLPSGRRAGDA